MAKNRRKIIINKADSFNFDLSLLKKYEIRENKSVQERDIYYY